MGRQKAYYAEPYFEAHSEISAKNNFMKPACIYSHFSVFMAHSLNSHNYNYQVITQLQHMTNSLGTLTAVQSIQAEQPMIHKIKSIYEQKVIHNFFIYILEPSA